MKSNTILQFQNVTFCYDKPLLIASIFSKTVNHGNNLFSWKRKEIFLAWCVIKPLCGKSNPLANFITHNIEEALALSAPLYALEKHCLKVVSPSQFVESLHWKYLAFYVSMDIIKLLCLVFSYSLPGFPNPAIIIISLSPLFCWKNGRNDSIFIWHKFTP